MCPLPSACSGYLTPCVSTHLMLVSIGASRYICKVFTSCQYMTCISEALIFRAVCVCVCVCVCRLALLNQKLTSLERQVEYIEARVTKT